MQLQDFFAFNLNAWNNLLYLFTSNIFNLLFLISMIGMIILRVKTVVDEHVEEHIGII